TRKCGARMSIDPVWCLLSRRIKAHPRACHLPQQPGSRSMAEARLTSPGTVSDEVPASSTRDAQRRPMLRGLFKRIGQLITGRGKVDEELFDELEEALIEADVGVHTATRLVGDLREATRRLRLSTPEEVRQHLRGEIAGILESPEAGFRWSPSAPTLCLVVGVNGTGKTTSIGKLAHLMRRGGKRVLIAAGDTFRAAAIDQL